MPLINKIKNMAHTATLKPLPTAKAKDFDELWTKLIEPNLPSVAIVQQWHDVLKAYVDKDDAVFFIRAFGSKSKNQNSTILRRGFYNTTHCNFSAVYVDNFFTSYFYSMARDGYVPTLSDFETCIKTRKFPCGYIQTTSEKEYASYFREVDPKIATKGYKIAHIFSAGENFDSAAICSTVGDFCTKFFPRGISTDWTPVASDAYGKFHYRHVNISPADQDNVRDFLKAHFMRTVHPINYFLVPKKGNICWNDSGDLKDEIGENPELINYVIEKIKERFSSTTIYTEFLSYIYPTTTTAPMVNKKIDANYGANAWKSTTGLSSAPSAKSSSSSTKTSSSKATTSKTASSRKRTRYTYSEKIEEAAYYLTHEDGLEAVEEAILGRNNSGSTAQRHLNDLGINTTSGHKGLLKNSNIDVEIAKATGDFKTTLQEIKKRGLLKP